VSRLETVEHREGRIGVLLRKRRLHLILWIVLIEGILVLFDAIPWWTVLVLAGLAFAFYVSVGRGNRNAVVRESSWIAAVSQLVVVLVPVLAVVLTTLAVIALVLVALGALLLLLLDRR
jgi:hypothetical protein